MEDLAKNKLDGVVRFSLKSRPLDTQPQIYLRKSMEDLFGDLTVDPVTWEEPTEEEYRAEQLKEPLLRLCPWAGKKDDALRWR